MFFYSIQKLSWGGDMRWPWTVKHLGFNTETVDLYEMDCMVTMAEVYASSEVLEVQEVYGLRMIRLRNPWGKDARIFWSSIN